MRPRILIVSYHAANPLTPRGARSQAVAAALSRHADVHVIAGAPETGRRIWWHRARDRAVHEVASRWLIDPQELWSWKVLGRRDPEADFALLIGFPFSPLVVAARALRRHGVPYVVDLSDPWAATRSPDNYASGDRASPTLRDRRDYAVERRLWSGASGGIVTTVAQARDLLRLEPTLDVLVRPNGYAEAGGVPAARRRDADDELRIGHFGNLYAPRVDIEPFFRRLVASGLWRRIVVQQYGRDHDHKLRRLAGPGPVPVTVQLHDPVPWPEVVRLTAAELDIALVIGNKDARQLPSKAIEYLTLPVPRLALTGVTAGDALTDYTDGKPGWLALTVDDADAAMRIWEHVRRRWTSEELAPPEDESWEVVADQLAAFVLRRMASTSA
jgi:hypothetical protein